MIEKELQQYLLAHYPEENAYCEWKEMTNLKNDFNGKASKDIISYVSAIANMEGGHLVIGVKDKTLDIVGTDTGNYNPQNATLKLTEFCANLSSEGLKIEPFITDDTNRTVWVIHIPKHQMRLPVYAHSKAWQRIEDSLVEMKPERRSAILNETEEMTTDWSAQIVPDATLEDLDPKAIRVAREKYIELHPNKENEIKNWDDITFLNKAHITIKGRITNASIILLGKEESEHFISPAICKIRWILKDKNWNPGDENKDFRILSIPMLLAVEEFSLLVRNAKYTYTISGNIFPESMYRYDVFTLREPLNNAIAHQDYSQQRRIEVVEYEDDKICYRNYGQFIPSSVEDVVENNYPESKYRNPFLVEAMRNINMVETEGGGIRKLYIQQKKRFFPMPIYDLSDSMVKCEIIGNVLDENFAKILVNNPSLSLFDIILLDKVQKHQPISDSSLAMLRKKKYVEGRKPNIYLSSSIVADSKHVGLKTSYIKNKGFDDGYFKKLILDYISQFGKASRGELDQLLIEKLPDSLNDKQKGYKIGNLLSTLKKENKIIVGKGKAWILVTDK